MMSDKTASVSSRPYAFYYSSTVVSCMLHPSSVIHCQLMNHISAACITYVNAQAVHSTCSLRCSHDPAFQGSPKKPPCWVRPQGHARSLIRVLTPCVHGEQHDQTALLLSIKAPRSRVRTPPPLTNSPSASSILHVHAVEAHLTYPHRDEGM